MRSVKRNTTVVKTIIFTSTSPTESYWLKTGNYSNKMLILRKLEQNFFVIIYAKEVVIFNMQTSFAKMYNVRIVGTAQNMLK